MYEHIMTYQTSPLPLRVWALGLLLLACVIFIPSSVSAKAQVVEAWSYYQYPPFLVGENLGLNNELIDLMSSDSDGKYEFKLLIMPRKRLDVYLKEEAAGIALFVNPIWIHKTKDQTCKWSLPLFTDSNEILSNVNKPVDYSGPESVQGMKFGGVYNHKYKYLDELVSQNKLTRINSNCEEVNILRVGQGRTIDFTLAPKSVLKYLINKNDLHNDVYFSKQPHSVYERHILMHNLPMELRAYINEFIKGLPNNPRWQKLKKKYQLQ